MVSGWEDTLPLEPLKLSAVVETLMLLWGRVRALALYGVKQEATHVRATVMLRLVLRRDGKRRREDIYILIPLDTRRHTCAYLLLGRGARQQCRSQKDEALLTPLEAEEISHQIWIQRAICRYGQCAVKASNGIAQVKMGRSDSGMIQLCSSCRAGDLDSKAWGESSIRHRLKSGTMSGTKQAAAPGDAEAGKGPTIRSGPKEHWFWQQVDQSHRRARPSASMVMLEMSCFRRLNLKITAQ